MAEHIALRFDWEDVNAQEIVAVLGFNSDGMLDGEGHWEAVAFCLQSTAVILTVEPDTDQMIVSHEEIPSGHGWKPIPTFDFAKSQKLGWCWVGINYLGYKDIFMLDVYLDGHCSLHPRYMFLAEGSSLSCFDLKQQLS